MQPTLTPIVNNLGRTKLQKLDVLVGEPKALQTHIRILYFQCRMQSPIPCNWILI